MVCKNRGIFGFLGTSWVLITYIICPSGLLETKVRYVCMYSADIKRPPIQNAHCSWAPSTSSGHDKSILTIV